MLTNTQVEHFKVFGFLTLKRFFEQDELSNMSHEYERNLSSVARLFAEPIGIRGQMNWSNFTAQAPFLSSSLELQKLQSLAVDLLGKEPVGVMANGNHFNGAFTEWHADTSIPRFRGLKVVAYLQSLDGGTGALRVLPGSHLQAYHEQLACIGSKRNLLDPGNPEKPGAQDEGHARAVADVQGVPSTPCATDPGDVIVFDLRLWHASWGGSAGRRMCSFTYFANPEDDAEFQAVVAFVEQLKREARYRELRRLREWVRRGNEIPDHAQRPSPQYPAQWLEDGELNPTRARWIAQLRRWGMIEGLAQRE